jgi:hypothetical protein
MSLSELALYGLALAFPLALLLQRFVVGESKPEPVTKKSESEPAPSSKENSSTTTTTIMQAERTDLAPPKDDPFTQEELKAFDGTDTDKPVYVAIKGKFVLFSPLLSESKLPRVQAPFSMYRGSVTRTVPAVRTRFLRARMRPAL